MNITQLQDLASSVGFPDPSLAAAVAMAESGGNPDVVGDLTLGRSVGLWQINLRAHPDYTEDDLKDPTTNAQAAFAISSGGTNWQPWTTYRTGAYLQYVQPYRPSVVRTIALAGSILLLAALAANAIQPGSVRLPSLRALKI